MCGPALALIGFAASAMGSVAQFSGQQAQANAQNKQWEQNYVNSLAAARSDQDQITLRQTQEQEAYGQKAHQIEVQAAQKQGQVLAAAGQGNVSGISVGDLLTGVSRISAENQIDARKNFEMTAQQLQAQSDATNNTAMSRINGVAQGVQPSGLSLVAGIAGGAVQGMTSLGKSSGSFNLGGTT